MITERNQTDEIWTDLHALRTGNGRLRAINAELVEALVGLRHQLWGRRRGFSEHDHEAMNKAGAALAKARGE